MPFTTDTYLSGQHLRPVPLRPEHHDDLVEGVRDGELWKLGYTVVPDPRGLAAEIVGHPDAQGVLHDTCGYRILASEWPSVKALLDFQLTRSPT